MWDKENLEEAIRLLTSFANELWQLDEPDNSEQIRRTITILERQLDMLNSFDK
jgi:hypothetical protein